MNNVIKYIVVLLAVLLLAEGCSKEGKKKQTWRITLNKEDKNAYGTYLFHQSMPYYWRHTKIEEMSPQFRYTSMDENTFYGGDSISMVVMMGLDYNITDDEWTKLKNFASAGNEIFIIGSNFDYKLTSELGTPFYGGQEELSLALLGDSAVFRTGLRLMDDSGKSYGYWGRFLGGYFEVATKDTASVKTNDSTGATAIAEGQSGEEQISTEESSDYITFTGPEVLGRNKFGANFIRYRVGQGGITLHGGPLAFSNYFLLQEGNREYLDGIWRHFPANISHIYYNEYYKRKAEQSDMNVLMKYPATKWALILGFLTLITYVLFGLKRRQRVVPVIKKVQNESASFVETVGRLYYNKGNHANLAEKMIQHFLEWVRTYYYLDTTQLDDHFISQLQSKSGKSEQEVRNMVTRILEVRLNATEVTPEYLYELNRHIQSFYNK